MKYETYKLFIQYMYRNDTEFRVFEHKARLENAIRSIKEKHFSSMVERRPGNTVVVTVYA